MWHGGLLQVTDSAIVLYAYRENAVQIVGRGVLDGVANFSTAAVEVSSLERSAGAVGFRPHADMEVSSCNAADRAWPLPGPLQRCREQSSGQSALHESLTSCPVLVQRMTGAPLCAGATKACREADS